MAGQQLKQLRDEYSKIQSETYPESEDHFQIIGMVKRLDVIGKVLLGNGDMRESLVFQVLELQRWRDGITKAFALFVVPVIVAILIMFFTGKIVLTIK
jgi:hypothetical protein